MKLLVLQETDWIKRGPHQQHHLMDRMALKGHEVRVIDHEYIRRYDNERKMITGRKEIKGAYKIFKDADITLIRPGMVKVSGLDMASILYFHKKEIKQQIKEFRPDVIIAFGILNAYIGMKQARKHNISFTYLVKIVRCARNMIERERTWENPFGDGMAGERIRRIMAMSLGNDINN